MFAVPCGAAPGDDVVHGAETACEEELASLGPD